MDEFVGYGEPVAIPEELNGPLPRTARLTGNGAASTVAFVVFAGMSLTLGIVFGSRGREAIEHRDALRRDGMETTGQITRAWESGRSGSTHNVSYTFEANGSEFSGESTVPAAQWRTMPAAGTLRVRYLAANPAVNHPADWEVTDASAWTPVAITAFLFIAPILLVYQLRLERQLILSGLPAVGTVTRCTRRRSGWSSSARTPGERVPVLYLEENPRRCRPYPLPDYRAAARISGPS